MIFVVLICELELGKLGLEFPKSKHRKYGEVPFEYAPTRTKGWKSLDRTKLQVRLFCFVCLFVHNKRRNI